MLDTWLLTRDDLKDLKFVRDFVLLVYEIKKNPEGTSIIMIG